MNYARVISGSCCVLLATTGSAFAIDAMDMVTKPVEGMVKPAEMVNEREMGRRFGDFMDSFAERMGENRRRDGYDDPYRRDRYDDPYGRDRYDDRRWRDRYWRQYSYDPWGARYWGNPYSDGWDPWSVWSPGQRGRPYGGAPYGGAPWGGGGYDPWSGGLGNGWDVPYGGRRWGGGAPHYGDGGSPGGGWDPAWGGATPW